MNSVVYTVSTLVLKLSLKYLQPGRIQRIYVIQVCRQLEQLTFFFILSSPHQCWIGRGCMEWEVCLTLVCMTSNGNWNSHVLSHNTAGEGTGVFYAEPHPLIFLNKISLNQHSSTIDQCISICPTRSYNNTETYSRHMEVDRNEQCMLSKVSRLVPAEDSAPVAFCVGGGGCTVDLAVSTKDPQSGCYIVISFW